MTDNDYRSAKHGQPADKRRPIPTEVLDTTAAGLADLVKGRSLRDTLRVVLDELEKDVSAGQRDELVRLASESLKLAWGVGQGMLCPRPPIER